MSVQTPNARRYGQRHGEHARGDQPPAEQLHAGFGDVAIGHVAVLRQHDEIGDAIDERDQPMTARSIHESGRASRCVNVA